MLVEVLSMGSRNNLGRFEKEVSSVEVWVGLARFDAGEKSVVVTMSPHPGLNDGCSWLRQRFQSNEEPLTERVGAKGEKTVLLTADVLASGWLNLIDDSYGR